MWGGFGSSRPRTRSSGARFAGRLLIAAAGSPSPGQPPSRGVACPPSDSFDFYMETKNVAFATEAHKIAKLGG